METNRTELVNRIAAALDTMDAGNSGFRGFKRRAERMTERLFDALYPKYASVPMSRTRTLREATELAEKCLLTVLKDAERARKAMEALFSALPEVRRQLDTDLQAAYRGDPAAKEVDEIILCYPGFFAIGTYRLAHVLYQQKVPLLPRVMTEYAHRRTGIDIHPGATIGDAFFIDHGTGVVIGETTTIGNNVKLYQHVTLGAKSFDTDANGEPVKNVKRHPDIGDRVIIYAGATILGGNTHIGNDCIIGGSVWLTHSVEAGKTVLARAAVTDSTLTRDAMRASVLDSAML